LIPNNPYKRCAPSPDSAPEKLAGSFVEKLAAIVAPTAA
jgi:hypothetical protein